MSVPVIGRRARRAQLAACLASAIVVIASCGATNPTPAPQASGAAPSTGTDASPGTSGAPGASQPTSSAPPLEPDSESKIAAAEAAGTIDHDTALLYDLYAALDYGSLPAAYQSSNPFEPEATTILAELATRRAQLSVDLQAKVAPFFLRPDDPDSLWAKRAAKTAVDPGTVRLAVFGAAAASEWANVPADHTPVRVWYDTSRGQAEADLALKLVNEIEGAMWTTEQTAMLGHEPCSDGQLRPNGEGPDLDVYLVYRPTGLDWGGRKETLTSKDGLDPLGLTIGEETGAACPDASFVIVDASLDFTRLKTVTAHELFHAIQFSFKNSWLPDRTWWMESTATWAEKLVYPDLDYARHFLLGVWSDNPDLIEGPIDSTDATDEYAAYLLPFYLVQKSGDKTGTAVGSIWAATESHDPLTALGNLPGWSDKFKEFALWNWNQGPAVKYVDPTKPIPPFALEQGTKCMDSNVGGHGTGSGESDCLLKVGKTTTSVRLGVTMVQYLEGTPDRPNVEKLTFDLSGVHGKAGLGIQAILSYGNNKDPEVEDWTDRTTRSFCVDAEDLKKVVLVVSNSSIDGGATGLPVSGDIKIEALAAGCSGWQGTMTTTYDWHAGGYTGTATATFSGIWEQVPSETPIVPCQTPFSGNCIPYVPNGTITWRWDSTQDPGCSEHRGGTFPAGAASDPRNAGGANGVPPSSQMLVLEPDGNGHFGYWGAGSWDLGERMKCSDGLHSVTDPPAYFTLDQGTSGTGAPDGTGNTCFHTTWQIDAKADTIKGNCFEWNNAGSSYLHEWNLTRVGKPPGG